MSVGYHKRAHINVPDYHCQRESIANAVPACQAITGAGIDAAVADLVLATLTPLALEVALSVSDELVHHHEQNDALRVGQVQRAQHNADQARRRYLAGGTRSPGSVVWLRRTLCVCYISTMGAEPGVIFNGHILGRDKVWHRLAEEEQPPTMPPPEIDPMPVQSVDPAPVRRVDALPHRVDTLPHRVDALPHSEPAHGPPYWVRYKRRWLFTAWMVGLVSGLAVTMVQTRGEPNFGILLVTFIMASITTGLVFGSLVNLLVALHAGSPEESLQPAGQGGAPRPVAVSVQASGKPMAMVCPDCEEMVNREALALHPRYCVVRAKSLSQLIFNE